MAVDKILAITSRMWKKVNQGILITVALGLYVIYQVEHTPSQMVDFNDTTCSERAFQRGMGQKIIAYSFWGGVQSANARFRKYFEGIKKNMELIKLFYPTYVMRLYVDFESENATIGLIKSLEEKNDNLGENLHLDPVVSSF